jgi:Trk-type K+ transport system membrane component
MNPNIGGRKTVNIVFKSPIEQRIRIQTVQNKTASALQWFAPSDVKDISSKMPEPAVNINPTDVSTVSTSSTQATEGSWTKTIGIGVVLILIMFALGGYYYYYYYYNPPVKKEH